MQYLDPLSQVFAEELSQKQYISNAFPWRLYGSTSVIQLLYPSMPVCQLWQDSRKLRVRMSIQPTQCRMQLQMQGPNALSLLKFLVNQRGILKSLKTAILHQPHDLVTWRLISCFKLGLVPLPGISHLINCFPILGS